MTRIKDTFRAIRAENKKALIPFFTAGDPSVATTVSMMHLLVKSGADVLEIGVPFSDPMADGPAIQRSSERALDRNVDLGMVLNFVEEFRLQDQRTPVVLMGYANPIESMGYKKFSKYCKGVGVDGVLVVDYPPEEGDQLNQELKRNAIDPIFLLAPTSTEERMRSVSKKAGGYVYYVSLKGVTGAANLDIDGISTVIPKIKKLIDLPIGVGFGIRDAKTARDVAKISDAVVIGSRIVEEIENSSPDKVEQNVFALVNEIRVAIDDC